MHTVVWIDENPKAEAHELVQAAARAKSECQGK